jgi:hypothetical protein
VRLSNGGAGGLLVQFIRVPKEVRQSEAGHRLSESSKSSELPGRLAPTLPNRRDPRETDNHSVAGLNELEGVVEGDQRGIGKETRTSAPLKPLGILSATRGARASAVQGGASVSCKRARDDVLLGGRALRSFAVTARIAHSVAARGR